MSYCVYQIRPSTCYFALACGTAAPGAGVVFGQVLADVPRRVYGAGDAVSATFQSACPRNNLRVGATFLTVERLDDATGDWLLVRVDRQTAWRSQAGVCWCQRRCVLCMGPAAAFSRPPLHFVNV
jgi:Neutral/alkaline non-lysosomal ceramidase, C-terminal